MRGGGSAACGEIRGGRAVRQGETGDGSVSYVVLDKANFAS